MHLFPRQFSGSPQPLDTYYSRSYFLWNNCADDETIQTIIKLGESLNPTTAKIGDGKTEGVIHQNTRVSSISWIPYSDQSKLFFDFFIDKIDRINYHNYGMNLIGMESIQYTKYPVGGHYKYHNDIIVKNKLMRKMSFVLSLSDQNDYTGGEFLLMPHGQNPEIIKFKKGDLIAFPSWIPHKVQPVTEGLRITAVTWAYGPLFI